ncbi:hypothetical protein [Xenorhabdus littoralis]|uniref:hypothetical protein n=1 Tax=Xenorhabdus littoralis TaxID=2582835 RepID=UPI0029E7DF95|nr:hypothetical protein [Xenorhabdus sp. Reich]
MPISGGARHNVNYTHEAALRCVGERWKLPGAVRIIPPHYVEWALAGLHILNGDTIVQAGHCPRTPANTEANGQSGHGLPPRRTPHNLTGTGGVSTGF